MSGNFATAAQGILLPTAPGQERATSLRLGAALHALGIPKEDHARWLVAEQRAWLERNEVSAEFRSVVRDTIFNQNDETRSYVVPKEALNAEGVELAIARLSERYFDIHQKLVEDHILEREKAHQLLSHFGMILRFRLLDLMSASEIARWIGIADTRNVITWKSVQTILNEVGCAPTLTEEKLISCFEYDTGLESDVFGDLTHSECIYLIGEIASNIGVQGNFVEWLSSLVGDGNHPPYVVILHYQLIVQRYFDHAVSYLYEFSPRGLASIKLKSIYVEAGLLHVEGNPFLNNAKAVERADLNWVLAKKDNKQAVRALSNILLALESVGPAVKSELSAHIRMLLCRIIRIETEKGAPLVNEIPSFADADLISIANKIAAENTATTGILEQRLVEVWACGRHTGEWSSRGVGDSVFAANTFRKKFGDCEFELPLRPNPQIHAYEAHGGRLTRHYVEDHIYTFGRVLKARSDSMTSIADLDSWRLDLTFIAHAIDQDLEQPTEYKIHDTNGNFVIITPNFMTFTDIIPEIIQRSLKEFRDALLSLNKHTIHPNVRLAVLSLA